jgi:hypothetical protein
MWDDLPDGLDRSFFADVSVDEEEKLRKANNNSVCISYDSAMTDDHRSGNSFVKFWP